MAIVPEMNIREACDDTVQTETLMMPVAMPIVCEVSVDVATVPEMDKQAACDDTVQTDTLTMPVVCEVSADVASVPEMYIRAVCDDTIQTEMPIVNAGQPDMVQVITGKTVKHRCRSFWSRIKKNVRRALCCGVCSTDKWLLWLLLHCIRFIYHI